jgi:predicted house-cleaning NTP pyrophosphatase (Maf/HAM1 superfamily)
MKAEALALSFGALIILVTFGDAYIQPFIGNLDTIFGLSLWKLMDILYPALSILVFLFYGRLKGVP